MKVAPKNRLPDIFKDSKVDAFDVELEVALDLHLKLHMLHNIFVHKSTQWDSITSEIVGSCHVSLEDAPNTPSRCT